MTKIKLFIGAHKITSIIVLVIIIAGSYWGYQKITSTSGDTRYVTANVQKGTVISSISGSGQVSDSNQIDVKAKVSGNVISVDVQDGQKISSGGIIAELDNSDAEKAVRDAEVNLESAQIALNKLNVQDSDVNLNANLAKAYDDGFSAVSNAFLDLPSIVTGFETILATDNLSENAARISGRTAQDYRTLAENTFFTARDAFETNRTFYRTLNSNSSTSDIEKIINQTYDTTKLISDSIKNLRNFVDFMAQDSGRSSAFTATQSTLSTYTGTINGHLDSLLSIQTDIKTFKDAFTNSSLDTQSQQLSIKQKENALQDAKDALADYFVRAPFAGTVTKIAVKNTDAASAGEVVATLITNKQLALISLNEVDVAKIKIGQKATLTFDAIPDLTIAGVVEDIDSIGALSQGVVTYGVKISFDTQDERVKSAMSVTASIITDIKQDVVVVPSSAIKSQAGTSYVEMFDAPLPPPTDGLIGSISKVAPNKIPVEVGLSDDSQSEIISGVKEGDEIVTRTILPTAAKATSAPSILGTGGNRGGGIGGVRIPTGR
jgi:HlyD family secretion protein